MSAAFGNTTSKRAFLKTLGAGALTGVLPTWRRAEAANNPYDLIVIGAGTAGMPAAIFAAERGAKVLVIEKSPVLGGTLDRSGGQMAASGTVFQKAKGIIDNPDIHFEDNMRINQWTADPMITRLFVDNAGESLNWLAANGFQVLPDHPVKGAGHEFFSVARYQWGKDGGKSILATMEPLFRKQVAAGKINLLTDTGAVDLIQDKTGAVVGVTAENDKGVLTDYMARNVCLASGGCASNPRLFADLHNTVLTARVAHPYAQGQGLILGMNAGGYMRGGELYLGSAPALLADDTYPSSIDANFDWHPDTRPIWEIFVNARGERFMREDHPSIDYKEKACHHQPGECFWILADQEMIEKAPPVFAKWTKEKFMKSFGTHPMFAKADSLHQLAVKANIHSDELTNTVRNYNRSINEGLPDVFNRTHRPLQINKGPYYAVRLTAWQLKSFAGLAVDGRLRVVRQDGTPIPNLFAAGEVIGGGSTGGGAYTNGSNVTPALTFGRLIATRYMNFKEARSS